MYCIKECQVNMFMIYVCVRACACVYACVRARACACMCACLRVCVYVRRNLDTDSMYGANDPLYEALYNNGLPIYGYIDI